MSTHRCTYSYASRFGPEGVGPIGIMSRGYQVPSVREFRSRVLAAIVCLFLGLSEYLFHRKSEYSGNSRIVVYSSSLTNTSCDLPGTWYCLHVI